MRVGVSLGLDDLTGQAGLTYRLTPSVNLVANIGRGFRVPNVFDLSTLGPRPGNRFNIPNPHLKPEKVLSVDTGLKWSFSRLRGEVFGFYSDFEDKIEAVPTGAVTSENRFIVQSRNLNSVILFGIEASGHFSAYEWVGTLRIIPPTPGRKSGSPMARRHRPAASLRSMGEWVHSTP